MQPTRRLAAILFTDIVGSTSMMQRDEQHAVSINRRYVAVLKECVLPRGGEILNDFGDGSLCCFSSATEALRCAIEMQQKFQIEPKVPLRIGLHVGEIFFEDGKVFGDGVNVASRVQSLGIANSILFSSEICSKIKNQQEFKSVSVGRFHFKNVDEPMEVFALANDGFVIPDKKKIEGKLKENKNPGRRKWLALAALILFAAISFLIYNHFASNNKIKSIAVLPFVNGSSDKQNEYLSDGIAQEIISQISKISSLEVKGWGSSVFFKNSDKSLKEKAEALGAEEIVTGSIEKDSDRVLIRVELTEANTGKRIWGDEYNRQWGDILNIQTEVAQKIANVLNTKLTPQEERDILIHSTENVEAYKFYRKGRYLWDKRTKESFDSAEVNYKHAIDLDPDYALAYSGLADLYIYTQNGLPPLKAIPIARDYAFKALSLDSTLSEALTTIGFIQSAFDYDWAKSKNTLEKAIRLNPNYPIAHVYYGNLLQYTGENTEEGIKEVKKALELDPLSVSVNWVLGRNYYLAKRYDLAYEQLKKTLILGPNYTLAKGTLIYVALEHKNFDEAMQLIKQLKLKDIWDYQGPYLCYYYAVAGDTTRAKAELMKMIRDYPDQSPYHLARCNVALKNYSVALDELEQAYAQKDIRIYNYLKTDPILDPIRIEPRFKALLKKTGLK